MKKLIPGQFVASSSNSITKGVVLDFKRGSISSLLNGTFFENRFANPQNSTGVAISNDNTIALISVTASPFCFVIDLPNENRNSPFSPALHDEPRDVQFSPDGSKILMAFTTSPYLKIYDYPSFTETQTFPVQPGGAVRQANFTPDGLKIVALPDAAPFIEVYDAANLTAITPAITNPPTNECERLAISPDNETIFIGGTASGSGSRAYNIVTGANLHSETTQLRGCAFTEDGSKVVGIAGFVSQAFQVWDASTWAKTNAGFSSAPFASQTTSSVLRSITTIGNDLIAAQYQNVAFIYRISTGEVIDVVYLNFLGSGSIRIAKGTIDAKITGVVTDDLQNPIERRLDVYHKETGVFVGSGLSDPATGIYEIPVMTEDAVSVVCIGDGNEITLIEGEVIPSPFA